MRFRSVLPVLAAVVLMVVPAIAQSGLPRVGTVIDTNERNYFLLFPGINDFTSATLRQQGGGYDLVVSGSAGTAKTFTLNPSADSALRRYLLDYERIVSVESDTAWHDRKLRWELLGGVVGVYQWLRPGRSVKVRLRDGSSVEGQALAVVDSMLILSSVTGVYDPARGTQTIWRVGLGNDHAGPETDHPGTVIETSDQPIGPIIYGAIGALGGFGLNSAINDGDLSQNILVGLATGATVYSLMQTGSQVQINTSMGSLEETARTLRQIVSFPQSVPPELLDRSRSTRLTTGGPIAATTEGGFRLPGQLEVSAGLNRVVGDIGWPENAHRYIDLAPYNTVGMRGTTALASPEWEYGVGLRYRIGSLSLLVGSDFTSSTDIPPVSGLFGDAAEFHAWSFHGGPGLEVQKPVHVLLQIVAGASFSQTHVVGWLNDRALSDNNPNVPEGTRIVYDITENETSAMYGAQFRIQLNNYISSQLRVMHRTYPSVTTPGPVDSTTWGSKLSSHTIEIGGWTVSAGINFHL